MAMKIEITRVGELLEWRSVSVHKVVMVVLERLADWWQEKIVCFAKFLIAWTVLEGASRNVKELSSQLLRHNANDKRILLLGSLCKDFGGSRKREIVVVAQKHETKSAVVDVILLIVVFHKKHQFGLDKVFQFVVQTQ